MKFAMCNYARFDHTTIDHTLRRDDVFVVDEEMEENLAFIEGLRLGNFEFVEITSIGELRKVIGVTDEMLDEFESALVDADAELEAETPPEVPEEPQEPPAEPEPPAEEEEPSSDKVPETQEAEKDEPPIAFTEETDSWQAAVALVNKETDVEKLSFALRNDERKSVKKACVARLAELKEEKA